MKIALVRKFFHAAREHDSHHRLHNSDARRFRCVKFYIVFILLLLSAPQALAKGDCIPNQRFVNEPDGRRILELRWLIDALGYRVRLRVPAEYVTWADVGCVSALGPNYPDPNYVNTYANSFSIGVLLPDFASLPPSERNIDRLGLDTKKLVASIDSNAGHNMTEENKRLILQHTFKDISQFELDPSGYFLRQSNLASGSKPDIYGLKRMGVLGDMEHFRSEPGPLGIFDFLYPDKDPIDVWFQCDAAEIKDHEEDSAWRKRPDCQMHFRYPPLDAMIQARFPRIFMPMWPKIKERLEHLLSSFEIGELNEGRL
jgi:hypothetical protein